MTTQSRDRRYFGTGILVILFTPIIVVLITAAVVVYDQKSKRAWYPAAENKVIYAVHDHVFIGPVTCSMNGRTWTVSADVANAHGVCRIEDAPKLWYWPPTTDNGGLFVESAVAVVSSVPVASTPSLFYENRHVVTFNQPIATHSVRMTDSKGCVVSKSSAADGENVVVQMQACEQQGYPPGAMRVEWTVNDASGEYELIIRKHH